jgi:HPt (histidine-containing phosphotransfer) domain-containing protein
VLKELFETLGREKALRVSGIFFEELDQFIQQCNQGIFLKDNHALAEAAHKIKGAAAMLGLDLLETPFAQLESDAREDNVRDLTNRIQILEDVVKQSEAMFNHYVSLIIK